MTLGNTTKFTEEEWEAMIERGEMIMDMPVMQIELPKGKVIERGRILKMFSKAVFGLLIIVTIVNSIMIYFILNKIPS